jgi:hypothetical protein
MIYHAVVRCNSVVRPVLLLSLSLFAGAIGCGSLLSRAGAQAPGQATDQATAPSAKQKMVSWVVLADSYEDFGIDALRKKLDEVFPGQFLPPRQKGNFVIAGPAPGQFLIFSNVPGAAGIFLLNNIAGPYTHFSKFAAAIADPALRSAIAKQCCWLSVDLIRLTTSGEDAHRFIEQALAKLAPADAAFLVDPDEGAMIVFDDKVRGRLARGEKLMTNP